MPAGARVASITANSSEFGGGGTINLTQNVSIDGAGDPAKVAEAVWEYTANEVQKLQYNLYA
jgi:hypothetical protein